MRVAVVFHPLEPSGGGAHTFTADLIDALRAAERNSHHTFVLYSTAVTTGTPGAHRIPSTRRERYRRRAIYALRDLHDRVSAPRPGLRTWLERSLERERVELVEPQPAVGDASDQIA